MRKITGSMLAVFFVIVLVGMLSACASLSSRSGSTASDASVVISDAKMSKDAKVVISGKGFKRGQEINVVVLTADGVQTDIGYALKPEPKPDNSGAWSSTWSAGRFVSKKLVRKGANRVLIFDGEYNLLVKDVVIFTD